MGEIDLERRAAALLEQIGKGDPASYRALGLGLLGEAILRDERHGGLYAAAAAWIDLAEKATEQQRWAQVAGLTAEAKPGAPTRQEAQALAARMAAGDSVDGLSAADYRLALRIVRAFGERA
jgi:hypothetical protein